MIMTVNTKVIHLSDAIASMQEETLGSRLRTLRESKKLSQGALAKKAGLKSQGTIGNIEADTRGYGESIVDIAQVLETSPEYLRLETNDPSPHHQPRARRGDLLESLRAISEAAETVEKSARESAADLIRLVVADPKKYADDLIPIIARHLSGELPDAESVLKVSNG